MPRNYSSRSCSNSSQPPSFKQSVFVQKYIALATSTVILIQYGWLTRNNCLVQGWKRDFLSLYGLLSPKMTQGPYFNAILRFIIKRSTERTALVGVFQEDLVYRQLLCQFPNWHHICLEDITTIFSSVWPSSNCQQ